jgi:hypothetical protein
LEIYNLEPGKNKMADLLQSLMEQDFGFLQIIADFWHVVPPVMDSPQERAALVRRMLEPSTFTRMISELPEEAGKAISELQQNDGRILWNIFTRKFGEVREFGSSRRHREQPYLQPVSPVEVLWYRALISRAFMKKSGLLQEFAFIPTDIMEQLPPPLITTPSLQLKINKSNSQDYLAAGCNDGIVDHCCTLLAAYRSGDSVNKSNHLQISNDHENFLNTLLQSAQLLDSNGTPLPEESKQHLESNRGTAWQFLFRSWSTSVIFKDLFSIQNLIVEKADQYSPIEAREYILEMISSLPVGEWIDIDDFIDHIKESTAEFLRPDGNFDSWLIRSVDTGEYLNGFIHWTDVEAVYIHHLLQGPLFWLGIIDLGFSSHARIPGTFRVTGTGHMLLLGSTPTVSDENGRIKFKAGSQILCPLLLPRWVRYLLARMAEWQGFDNDGYTYQFTPQSLAAARKQNLRVSHLETLLRKYGSVPPTPGLIRALQRWEDNGSEVSLESMQVLRVTSPEILKEIMKSKAARYLAEPLGPTAVVMKPGTKEKVTRLLIESGYLGEIK